MKLILILSMLCSTALAVDPAVNNPSNSPLYMDRSVPLGNSTDVDGRQALHIKIKNTGSEPISVTTTGSFGKTSIALARNVYSSVNVTTGAYVQLVASTSDMVNTLQIFDSSGQTMILAVGGAGSEVDKLYIPPGGNGNVDLTIASGSRVSVKAVSGNATSGELNISFLK